MRISRIPGFSYSMIKAKFGDSLRSKTNVAMVNEALCNVLCHNLCCLIQSAYELGVEATIWGKEGPKLVANIEQETSDAETWDWV